jgi:hypothetical protein
LTILTIVLALSSSLPWYVSQIMPDIFISIGALSLALLLVKERGEISLKKFIFYLTLLFISSSVHVSHLVILTIVTAVFAAKYRKQVFLRSNRFKFIITAPIFIFSFILFSAFNFKDHHQFKISVASNVFLLGRFAESGILQKYINATCSSDNRISSICSLEKIPTNSEGILWDANGFMKQFNYNFIEADTYAKYIVNDVLTNPKYLFPFIYDCAINSVKQMFQLNIASGMSAYREGSAPSYPIFAHFEFEKNYFLNSEQSFSTLNFKVFNSLNYFAICISLVVISYFYFARGLTDNEGKFLFILLTIFVVNALITASLANVYDRLQARITWPLVFFSAVLVIKEITLRKKHSDE